MAKTNPIGVRFDETLLKCFKDNGVDITPQKALSMYEAMFKREIEINIASISGRKEIKIYKLINPLTDLVFYIGRTTFDLPKRLVAHIGEVKAKTTTETLNKRKISIIKEIVEAGKKPIIEQIESFIPVSDDEYKGYHEKEVYWMLHYIKLGHILTNKISEMMLDAMEQKINNPIPAPLPEKLVFDIKEAETKTHPKYNPKDPTEGSAGFYLKYGVFTYDEIKT